MRTIIALAMAAADTMTAAMASAMMVRMVTPP
jgi:hypothetical protein